LIWLAALRASWRPDQKAAGLVQTRIVFVIIVADERGNPTLYRVVYDVLKFADKGDLSIYRPTLKIIMPAPIA
jgi:hypothetical protein